MSYFAVKNEWRFGYSFQNFAFDVKNEWPFCYNCKILHFTVKNEWPFECNSKILYFADKKRMAVWVHAYLQKNIHGGAYCYGSYIT